MAEIQKMDSLLKKLQEMEAKSRTDNNGAVIVGFTQNYALYVHENLEAHHPVGQAKFLEQPFRELLTQIPVILKKTAQAGKTLLQGLLIAGLRLQREAQKRCPVDTGALKNSAFTRIEGRS